MKKQWFLWVCMFIFYCLTTPAGVSATEQQTAVNQDRIIADNTAIITAHPYDVAAHYRRGKAYFAKKEFDLALQEYNRAIAVAMLNRGYLYEKQGLDNKAIEEYTLAIANDPTYEEAYDHRGFMYNKTGRPDLALIDCSKALEINPKFIPGYLNKGTAYEKLHLTKEAMETYRGLLANAPLEDVKHREVAKQRILALGGTI